MMFYYDQMGGSCCEACAIRAQSAAYGASQPDYIGASPAQDRLSEVEARIRQTEQKLADSRQRLGEARNRRLALNAAYMTCFSTFLAAAIAACSAGYIGKINDADSDLAKFKADVERYEIELRQLHNFREQALREISITQNVRPQYNPSVVPQRAMPIQPRAQFRPGAVQTQIRPSARAQFRPGAAQTQVWPSTLSRGNFRPVRIS